MLGEVWDQVLMKEGEIDDDSGIFYVCDGISIHGGGFNF